ncbi:hypothetical protein FDP41_000267 [Naegleria fowleri]|uniref:Eukaryotic translation initiation factor 3 subunit E N-terminal domain-containing protein n=1 Tax=Naegleria fowleri TaxID=5763 RepID=A0A6A5CJ60_NAEFO|nr:uncharacterized protein FDP41_000267 [Naegleria fowleri]KAF0985228.1 hypothetical protein FDP41_000267 [Naegleria fowleri]
MNQSLALKIIPFLDVHLMFPLLEFLEQNEIYPKQQVQLAAYELSKKTKMLDFQKKKQEELGSEANITPIDYQKEEKEILDQIENYKQVCEPLLTKLKEYNQNKESIKESLQVYLSGDSRIKPEMLDKLYDYAKFIYETGDYETAAALLSDVKQLYGEVNIDKAYMTAWGKLASELMCKEWESASAALNDLRELMENRFQQMLQHERSSANAAASSTAPVTTPITKSGVKSVELDLINARCWFIHWSLFVAFFDQANGYKVFLDLFFPYPAGTSHPQTDLTSNRYISALFQSNSSYILRYLAVIIILKKRNKTYLNGLVKFMEQHLIIRSDFQQQDELLSDPVIQFIYQLNVNHDFKAAYETLITCENILKNDYFTASHVKEFMNQGKNMIFESYAKVSHVFAYGDASKTDFPLDEEFITSAINSLKIQATVDSEHHRVTVKKHLPNIYQQILERTEESAQKTHNIAVNVKNLQAQRQSKH